MKKKIVSLLLALTMMVSLLPVQVLAAGDGGAADAPVVTELAGEEQTPENSADTEEPEESEAPAEEPAEAAAEPAAEEPVTGEASVSASTEAAMTATTAAAVPTLQDGVSPTAEATVLAGAPYSITELNAGKVFWNNEKNRPLIGADSFYYRRSADGGKTWSNLRSFCYPDQDKGFTGTAVVCTLMESKPGDYMYRICATMDGKNFSEDTWTLTLHVKENSAYDFDFMFCVGKDYNGNYPILKLYNVVKDASGKEVLGDELKNCFLYSNYTSTLPDGEAEYDPAMGKLENELQRFYTHLSSGRYAYRAFGYNEATNAYDIPLGGMTLQLPLEQNDVFTGKNQYAYIICAAYGVDGTKKDGTGFGADDFKLELNCPAMNNIVENGTPFEKDGHTYYPAMVFAQSRGCLYGIYVGATVPGYGSSVGAGEFFDIQPEAQLKLATLETAAQVTYTVPSDATFNLYRQLNNFNTRAVEPIIDWKDNGDGTKSATYEIKRATQSSMAGTDLYTWRLSDATHVTRAGFYKQGDIKEETYSFTLSFDDGLNPNNTQRISHDRSGLGTGAAPRDEADIQVGLDPTGYKVLDGTSRLRAYRFWELISSDVANVIVEPDFHWDVISGDVTFTTVNGGNGGNNWADVTPGTEDSVIATWYDSIDVNPQDHASTCGLFPATSPERVAVSVVAGTGTKHGTAEADVRYNPIEGNGSARPYEWDYSFDTWFYNAQDTKPTLNFTVTGTGKVAVEYAFVTANESMQAAMTKYSTASGSNGSYTVPLSAFSGLGNGKGGTVIIRMTDDTGVSYRLVRVAKVTPTLENVTHPGEPFTPGDTVRVTFNGLYRGINKVAGTFNPTALSVTYTTPEGNLRLATAKQYERMDTAVLEFTIPRAVTFEDGADSMNYVLSDGHISGNMYSASNPFNFMYTMTDLGMPTNFAALLLRTLSSHLMDISVPVQKQQVYDVRISAMDTDGKAIENMAVTMTNSESTELIPVNGLYKDLAYGTYHYYVKAEGYVGGSGSFSLSGGSAAQVKDGVLTITVVLKKALEGAWDGTTATEPKQVGGVYQIGTGAELAWFAKTVNDGTNNIKGKLTKDIELAGCPWTPIGNTSKGFTGELDGAGFAVRNLCINSTADNQGLIGRLGANGKVHDLTVTGSVTTTGNTAGGIVGHAPAQTSVINCLNEADVTAKTCVAGVVGKTQGNVANANNAKKAPIIKNCGNTGTITATDAKSGNAGGIAAIHMQYQMFGGVFTDCINVGGVAASKKAGGVTVTTNGKRQADGGGNYYLSGCLSGSGDKPIIGVEKTADELMEMLKDRTDPVGKGLYEALQRQKDQPVVDDVIAKIGAIGTVTRGSKASIDAARKAYDGLTDAQKELVPADVLKTLTDAETAYANLPRSSGSSGSAYTGGHTFTTDLEPGSITGVFVDGKKLDSRYYTVSGSDVTLTVDYLKTLRNGKHTVKIENAAKVATGSFTLSGSGTVQSSRTGDPGVAIYAAMGAVSFLGSAAWLRKRKET